MEQEYLIDSNILIGYLDNKLTEKGMAFMNKVVNATPNISVITKIEVLRYRTSDYNYQILKDFIDSSVVHHLDNLTVDQTIELCRLKKIKLPDAIIASTAIVNNQVLITRNVSDFKSISALELLNPFDSQF
jgi:predicted nucleic acid-binding protein